ncbi:MAG: guanylate kinase [Omnitrophica WOR_2 bacterium RIFCSPHIGHO2_02_FULL_50_17]|nr:MAG: guanylate kinase [Omnitrophica WOR_2 bacterium RIFCSPHIGHO2_02_FULL_50_17]
MIKKGKIIILSGPSGSGKTTLYKKLLASRIFKGKIVKAVSVTTRLPRPGERGGRDYFFVSRKTFLYKKKAGHFLESQKVFDNYYGTPKKQVQELLRDEKNVLLCIDVKGAGVVGRKFPEAVRIFIKTASLAALKERLLKRGSEDDGGIRLRLNTAREELKEAGHYDYIVINEDLRKAYREIEQIILFHIYSGRNL